MFVSLLKRRRGVVAEVTDSFLRKVVLSPAPLKGAPKLEETSAVRLISLQQRLIAFISGFAAKAALGILCRGRWFCRHDNDDGRSRVSRPG